MMSAQPSSSYGSTYTSTFSTGTLISLSGGLHYFDRKLLRITEQ